MTERAIAPIPNPTINSSDLDLFFGCSSASVCLELALALSVFLVSVEESVIVIELGH